MRLKSERRNPKSERGPNGEIRRIIIRAYSGDSQSSRGATTNRTNYTNPLPPRPLELFGHLISDFFRVSSFGLHSSFFPLLCYPAFAHGVCYILHYANGKSPVSSQ